MTWRMPESKFQTNQPIQLARAVIPASDEPGYCPQASSDLMLFGQTHPGAAFSGMRDPAVHSG